MPKLKIALSVFAWLFVASACSAEPPPTGVTVQIGRLGPSPGGAYTNLPVTVNNDTNGLLSAVIVECGFFGHGELISTDHTALENVPAKSQAYGTVSVSRRGSEPDEAKCRISSVNR
jgi:hypothetical protein